MIILKATIMIGDKIRSQQNGPLRVFKENMLRVLADRHIRNLILNRSISFPLHLILLPGSFWRGLRFPP